MAHATQHRFDTEHRAEQAKHYRSVDPHALADHPEVVKRDGLVSAVVLSQLTGVSVSTPAKLAKGGMLAPPVAQDEHGFPLFDAYDPRLQEWVCALQRAKYGKQTGRYTT
jgi:hypothetical protein